MKTEPEVSAALPAQPKAESGPMDRFAVQAAVSIIGGVIGSLAGPGGAIIGAGIGALAGGPAKYFLQKLGTHKEPV